MLNSLSLVAGPGIGDDHVYHKLDSMQDEVAGHNWSKCEGSADEAEVTQVAFDS